MWILGFGALGIVWLEVQERAGWTLLTWAHGCVVAGSLLTQWPTALRAV